MSAPLPKYTGRLIEEAPQSWQWGVLTKEKKHITDLFTILHALKEQGMKGSVIIGTYHMRRVAPLMARASPARDGAWSVVRGDGAC